MSKFINISLPKDQEFKFKRWLTSVANKNDRDLGTLITGAGLKMQRLAIMFAPVDMGFLRTSIRPKFAPDRKSVEVYANKKYAPYQEFGTRPSAIIPKDSLEFGIDPRQWLVGNPKRLTNVRPNPFMLPAGRLTKQEMFIKLHQMGFK